MAWRGEAELRGQGPQLARSDSATPGIHPGPTGIGSLGWRWIHETIIQNGHIPNGTGGHTEVKLL
jgi:hypothetical protein